MNPRLLVHGWVAIFEVHVPDAVGELTDAGKRIATAKCPVPGVEYETDNLGVSHVQNALGFGWRLDPGAGVMMQHRAQASFIHHAAGGGICALGKDAPALLVQAHLGGNAPGIQAAHGIGVRVGSQHNEGIWSADSRQQFRRAQAGLGALFMPVAVLKVDIHPGAQHFQVALLQLGTQLRRVGGHETPIAQLGAGVTAGGDLVQDARIVVPFAFNILDNAPRAGRVSHLHDRHLRHCRKPRCLARDRSISAPEYSSFP